MGGQINQSKCVGCGLSRRDFMAGCAAGMIMLPRFSPMAEAALSNTGPEFKKPKIRLVFSHINPDTPTWPNIGYDYEGRKKELTEKLRKSCPDIEFLPATARNGNEAKKILEGDKEVDGYICYMIGIWTGVPQTIMTAGKPTIFVDDLYAGSGEFLVAYSAAKRQKLKVAGVSSSKFEDVVEAARCFGAINKLKSSAIVRVGSGFGCSGESVEKVFGTKVVNVDHKALDDCYKKADKNEAKKWADKWIGEAQKVVEPSREELEKSGAMYLAMCQLMQDNNAQAITINCLGGFYGGKITAYPCMGFFQLNNDGLVGACESDMTSTITMLVMGYLTGRPGYISDPVIDTSKNQIIYAHCVAPNKVYGKEGKTNPYHIRDHSEDRKGACVCSYMPAGEITTSLEIDPSRKQIVMHRAKTVGNIEEDKACRTKLAAEVIGDIDKLMTYWDQWGWHRVTVYGDQKRCLQHFATLTGFELIEEA